MTLSVYDALKGNAKTLYKAFKKIHDDQAGDKALILAACKTSLADWKTALQTRFEAGEYTGLKTATRMASLHDDLLSALFKHACVNIFPREDKAGDIISLCAVGGYGRGEMAPFSDLDLLFLVATKEPSERSRNIAEYVLYMMWDMNLKVGHAVRTPDQCIALARDDETVLSALLDLRMLSGDPDPAKDLVGLLRKERTRGKIRAFTSAKLGARDGRHNRAGNSRYVIEPNVKEGKGGLRDLHELYWIARFAYGKKGRVKSDAPKKPHGVTAYVRHGLLNAQDGKRFTQAAEFLWQVRHHIHYTAGRATEVLSFDKQDAVAVRMGFDQEYPEERVEAFMRQYFMTAREVGALTRIACAKLESQNAILLPQGLDRFLPTSRRGLSEAGFVLDHGRLNFSSARALKKNPIHILRLFLIAGVRNLDIHPDAFGILLANMHLIDDDFRASPEASQIFMDILLKSAPPGAVLQTMNEAGVLGEYLPEFGAIVAQTQFNMHHAYTVDDHTIGLIKFLHDIESGELEREHPLTTKFMKTLNARHRKCVYLACLFHDVGKSEGDQCLDGARMSRIACERLGLPDTDTDTISWLVRNHLEMSETAQRRDLSDPETIRVFADKIGSIARLQMLTALTVVDIRAVGPGIWNDWKGELLRQLYRAAREFLFEGTEGTTGDDTETDFTALNQLLTTLPAKTQTAAKPIFISLADSLGQAYWQNTPLDVQKEHAAFFKTVALSFDADNDDRHFVHTKVTLATDITEIWIISTDRKRLFADITGALAQCGASVVGAQLYTGEDGFVFNIFYLQNPDHLAFGRQNPSRIEKLEKTVLIALNGKLENPSLPAARSSVRADAIPIHPRANFMPNGDNNAIIEIAGRDHPGLLCELGLIMDAYHLSIRSAHMEVLGPKAIDVFYVDIDPDHKIDDQALCKDLLSVFGDDE